MVVGFLDDVRWLMEATSSPQNAHNLLGNLFRAFFLMLLLMLILSSARFWNGHRGWMNDSGMGIVAG